MEKIQEQIQERPQLQFYPLGGLGEIGSNMMLIKTDSEWVIIDAGILFPHDQNYGLQALIPDYSHLDVSLTTSLIVTHAHEDHIGAIPFLVRSLPNIIIYASPLAARIIESKINGYLDHLPLPEKYLVDNLPGFQEKILEKMVIFNDDSLLSFNEIDVYPIRTNHSIPESYALLIQNKDRSLSSLYLSDFKFDDRSPYERPTNFARLKALSNTSTTKLLFLDSTNILGPEKANSEADLVQPFREIFSNSNSKSKSAGKIFITFFPSNLNRLQTFLDLAFETNKKIIYYGRSLINYTTIANQLGLLNKYHETKLFDLNEEIDLKSGNFLPETDLIVLLTGCQGDLYGSLNRIASEYDPIFKFSENDTVVFSSRVIPGNENRVKKIYNKISKLGAKIITVNDQLVHVSGHGGKEDIKTVIDNYAPTDFIPIHGETYFLHKHAEFVATHYPHIHTHLLSNFETLMVKCANVGGANVECANVEGVYSVSTINKADKHKADKHNQSQLTYILESGIAIEKTSLNERKKLAQNGCVFVTITSGNIRICFLGLPQFIQHSREEIEKLLRAKLEEFKFCWSEETGTHLTSQKPSKKTVPLVKVEEALRVCLRNYLELHLNFRPIVVIHLL